MGPYLAVIVDSFRAASASRVLWIALAAVILFLIALAPVGYRENVVTRVSPRDIVDAQRLAQRLRTDLKNPSDRPSARIAAALPETIQQQIRRSDQPQSETRLDEQAFADAFSELLQNDDAWYDAEAWQSTTRLRELRRLDDLSASQLSEDQRLRRARLRLEAGLRGAIRPRPEKTLSLTYATFSTPAEWPLSQYLFRQTLTSLVLPPILNGLLGIIGIVLGILVTAPILPEMLQPGSLHLLLSKPVSRPLLYLAKFLGGCAFMLMCVGPLLVGVWLILGWRFDLWLGRLFYCIPVYLLLFMVYYSVSCLAALQWKSPIVAALVAMGFWVACGAIGIASSYMDEWVSEPARLTGVTLTGVTLTGVTTESLDEIDTSERESGEQVAAGQRVVFGNTRGGELQYWDQTNRRWQTVALEDYPGEVILGPVPIGNQQFAATRKSLRPFGVSGEGVLALVDADEQFAVRRGGKLPGGASRILSTSDGAVLAFGSGGVAVATAERLREGPAAEVSGGGLFGSLTRLLNSGTKDFQSVLPGEVFLQEPFQVALLASDDVILYSAGTLKRIDRQADSLQWDLVASAEVQGDVSREAVLGASATTVAVVRKDEPIQLFDADTLEAIGELQPPGDRTIVSLSGDPHSDTLAVRFSDRSGALLKTGPTPRLADLPDSLSGESLELLRYDHQGRLLAVYDHDSVRLLGDLAGPPELELEPRLSSWRMINEYLVQPLRYVIPQTGELRAETVRAALSGEDTQEFGQGMFAEQVRRQLNVKRPVFTCLGFTAVMLLIGGIIFTRQDY